MTRARGAGLTLIELMIVVAIVGLLASFATVGYQNYVLKARLTEVVLWLGHMRRAFQIEVDSTGGVPRQVLDSVNRDPNRPAGDPMPPLSQHLIKLPDSDVIQEYWFDRNSQRGIGWMAVRFEPGAIANCQSRCSIHIGFKQTESGIDYHCGRWNNSSYWGKFPVSLMPETCRETCVSCRLR